MSVLFLHNRLSSEALDHFHSLDVYLARENLQSGLSQSVYRKDRFPQTPQVPPYVPMTLKLWEFRFHALCTVFLMDKPTTKFSHRPGKDPLHILPIHPIPPLRNTLLNSLLHPILPLQQIIPTPRIPPLQQSHRHSRNIRPCHLPRRSRPPQPHPSRPRPIRQRPRSQTNRLKGCIATLPPVLRNSSQMLIRLRLRLRVVREENLVNVPRRGPVLVAPPARTPFPAASVRDHEELGHVWQSGGGGDVRFRGVAVDGVGPFFAALAAGAGAPDHVVGLHGGEGLGCVRGGFDIVEAGDEDGEVWRFAGVWSRDTSILGEGEDGRALGGGADHGGDGPGF